MRLCCFYWSKECKVSYNQYCKIIPNHYRSLQEFGIVKEKDAFIRIDWLDKQFKETKEAHEKRVRAGRKGGKQSSSNAQALRKEEKRKDKYTNDNLLKVQPEVQKILDS